LVFAYFVAVAGAFAAAWIAYFRWKDRAHPEPRTMLLIAALMGAVAVIPALGGYEALAKDISWDDMAGGTWPSAIKAALFIGFAEELAKFFPVLIIALRCKDFDELLDGPVYAAAAAIGFSWAETVVMLSTNELEPMRALARAATAPITHALFAVMWGAALAVAIHEKKWLVLPLGLIAGIVAHASYDLLLARSGIPATAAMLVLALWI
jgi:protease PrsW